MSTAESFARSISILGHPMLVMPVAALLAAHSSGLGMPMTLAILGGVALPAAIALGYSVLRVRHGHWQHVDASARTERRNLNRFLLGIFLIAAVVAWWAVGMNALTFAFALSAAIILLALGLERWCKLSLHVAFISFAALVPGDLLAMIGFGLLGIAVAWSRLALARHDGRDLVAGLLAGVAAGIVFQGL